MSPATTPVGLAHVNEAEADVAVVAVPRSVGVATTYPQTHENRPEAAQSGGVSAGQAGTSVSAKIPSESHCTTKFPLDVA